MGHGKQLRAILLLAEDRTVVGCSQSQQQADEGQLNWNIHFVDGSVIRAHQHAAGAKRLGADLCCICG